MRKLLYTVAAATLVAVFGVSSGMERESVNWHDVIAKTQVTSVENPMCQSAVRVLEGDASANWSDIEQYALEGDPVSQYCMALKCDSLAKDRYNGERKKLRIAEAMFLLLSSQKGKYVRATELLIPLLPLESPVDFSNFKQVETIAAQLALRMDESK